MMDTGVIKLIKVKAVVLNAPKDHFDWTSCNLYNNVINCEVTQCTRVVLRVRIKVLVLKCSKGAGLT